MKKIKSVLLALLLFSSYYAQATWSIIVIDPKTKEIGIAGASCTYSVYGIGAIIPNKGAIIVQAMSNDDARQKGLEMIMADASPEEIIKALRDPKFDPEQQQYAVITLKYINNGATYTGKSAYESKGTLTAKGISVQGNILTSPNEIKEIMQAALKAQKAGLSIANVLMLALEAGAKLGGDKRCGDRKALSAFITVYQPTDDKDKPFLNLVVLGNSEDLNAVTELRKKFDSWKKNPNKS